ncbi:MAG: ECF transporter S component [Caldisericia bacterium]|nr:ECF transporter S component [Caldisericia bacterium]
MGATKQIKSMVIIALLSALSFAGTFIQLSFWLAPWLKFDLSEIFCILGGIIFGPWIGLLIVGLKNVLRLMVSPDLIGHAMNFFAVGTMTVIVGYFCLLAKKRNKQPAERYSWIVAGLILGIIVRIGIMIPINWVAILYTPYKEVFMVDGVYNWGFARAYVYTTTTIFNGIQGVVSAVLVTPLLLVWEKVLRPSLSPSEK